MCSKCGTVGLHKPVVFRDKETVLQADISVGKIIESDNSTVLWILSCSCIPYNNISGHRRSFSPFLGEKLSVWTLDHLDITFPISFGYE